MGRREKPSEGTKWWAEEFQRQRSALIAHLNRRGLHWLAEDIVAKLAVELAAYDERGDFPAEDAEQLTGLLWRMLRFRTRDELRRKVVHHISSSDLDEVVGAKPQAEPGEEVSQGIDARRFLLSVAQQIEGMNDADRSLIMRDVDEERSQPLSGGERVRLLRLRRSLASRAIQELRGKGSHR